MKLALIGYGNVGRALARLLRQKQSAFPFSITGIHTARHGTAVDPRGLSSDPHFHAAAPSIAEFLDTAKADAAVELSTLNPVTGQPAIDHIRAAFARGMHVVTANKGPVAHAYAELRDEAERRRLKFRFEATVMDGAPVFNQVNGQQEQVQKYARRLADQETQLASLRDRQSEFERKRAALQSELNSLIEKIDF